MLLKIPDTFTLETEADVRALRDLLDCYLRLAAPTMPAETPIMPAPPSLPEQPETPAATPAGNPAAKKTKGKQATLGPKYLASLRALGKPASVEDVYQQFLNLGLVSRAKNPRDAITHHFRHRDDLYQRLPPDAQGRDALAGEGRSLTEYKVKARTIC